MIVHGLIFILLGVFIFFRVPTNVLYKGRASNLIWAKWAQSREIEKNLPEFPKYLFYLISGFLLSQGATFVQGSRGNKFGFRFRKKNLLLVLYVANLFKLAGYALGNVNLPKGMSHFEFVTFHTNLFTAMHNVWYKDDIFQVPNYVFTEFNPLILAGWFIVRGKKSGKKLVLSGESLTREELEKFVDILNNKYDLDSSTKHRKIFINNLRAAINLIEPFVHSSEYYRFLTKK